MNDQMNAPMSPVPASPTSFFQVWLKALTKPSEQTYTEIAASPDAKMSTAFIWVFVGSLVQFFATFLVQGALMRQMMQDSGFDNQMGAGLIGLICGAPIGAVISVLLFAIFTGIVQWVAGLFGGQGSFEKLAYVFASITVPFSLVGAALTLLAAIPYVGFCFGIFSLIAAIYVVVLEVMAVKGVNQFGWGQAAGSLLLPFFGLLCCVSAVVIGIFSLLGPAMQDIFNQINQSLTPP